MSKNFEGVNIDLSEAELRAIVSTSDTPFTVGTIEELEKTTLMLTPEEDQFTPMLTRLRPKAKSSIALKFEWNDTDTDSTFSGSLYDGYTPPTSNTSSPSRRDNYIMPLSRVAKVSKFTNSFGLVDVDAMNNEMRDRYIELKRSVEYYIWNGNETVTSPIQQTKGIKRYVTTAVDNATTLGAAQVLQEATLKEAIAQMYAEGIVPRIICATPPVASTIADFSLNNGQANGNNLNGVPQTAFTYRSPFGFALQVVPVLEDFLGTSATGEVYILDDTNIVLRYPSKERGLINSEPLAITQHGQATIIYSFMGVQVKKAGKMRKITNVLNQ